MLSLLLQRSLISSTKSNLLPRNLISFWLTILFLRIENNWKTRFLIYCEGTFSDIHYLKI
ncbi:hypothetical protein BpHYR1_012819 [Brachionus plicatilis]|uniref:Uncharacterized protein n=1 Tax=Brachionus plicatilis TaxID=10195 RepID=A0A3M7SJQ6_BRAPC|nr:hypothetical protein BpHYR1_012819 [Brachionus plicatilis]